MICCFHVGGFCCFIVTLMPQWTICTKKRFFLNCFLFYCIVQGSNALYLGTFWSHSHLTLSGTTTVPGAAEVRGLAQGHLSGGNVPLFTFPTWFVLRVLNCTVPFCYFCFLLQKSRFVFSPTMIQTLMEVDWMKSFFAHGLNCWVSVNNSRVWVSCDNMRVFFFFRIRDIRICVFD